MVLMAAFIYRGVMGLIVDKRIVPSSSEMKKSLIGLGVYCSLPLVFKKLDILFWLSIKLNSFMSHAQEKAV